MGNFVDLAAVLAPMDDVRRALEGYSGRERCCSIQADRTLILYEEPTGDFERVQKLSHLLAAATFACHIHDDDLWLYEFYLSGERTDRFNTMPEYWGKLSSEEKASLHGDAGLLARHWSELKADTVERYLRSWEDMDEIWNGVPRKAYSEDEYAYGDCWQLTDFLRKLGTPYPSEDA